MKCKSYAVVNTTRQISAITNCTSCDIDEVAAGTVLTYTCDLGLELDDGSGERSLETTCLNYGIMSGDPASKTCVSKCGVDLCQ